MKQNIAFFKKIYRYLRPEAYNRITILLIVIGGGLIGTPIYEAILEVVLEKQFDIILPNSNEPYIGLGIIILAIIYNLVYRFKTAKEEEKNGKPYFWSRKKARKAIQPKLDENREIYQNYGPYSEKRLHSDRESEQSWDYYSKKVIIPNNEQVLEILDNNHHLLKENEKAVVKKFRLHTTDFKQNKESDVLNPNRVFFPKGMNTILE